MWLRSPTDEPETWVERDEGSTLEEVWCRQSADGPWLAARRSHSKGLLVVSGGLFGLAISGADGPEFAQGSVGPDGAAVCTSKIVANQQIQCEEPLRLAGSMAEWTIVSGSTLDWPAVGAQFEC